MRCCSSPRPLDSRACAIVNVSGATTSANTSIIPACAQGYIFSIVRANFQKYDLYSAPIARALPRYIVPFFKFFKTGKCFKTMLFPVSSVSQKPLAFQKHSLLLIQPKTHAKTLSERSENCASKVCNSTGPHGHRQCSARNIFIARAMSLTARAIPGIARAVIQ